MMNTLSHEAVTFWIRLV
jgi:hypothetical protein